jgi:hypothetical protein
MIPKRRTDRSPWAKTAAKRVKQVTADNFIVETQMNRYSGSENENVDIREGRNNFSQTVNTFFNR